ncbi:cell division protein ZipA C-terminal FtsZ-binding domain-containing protein [Moraxella oculi]|uniref:Cell division protein ZipA n=1 Tax=Moraxella oculi TaxID=2940516 RepID=A0ABW8U9F4_9GAMM
MDNHVWLIVAVVAICLGLLLMSHAIFRAKKGKNKPTTDGVPTYKNGLPITPRDERSRQPFDSVPVGHKDKDEAPDALTSMAAVASSSAIVVNEHSQQISAPMMSKPNLTTEQVPEDIMVHKEGESMSELNHSFKHASPVIDAHLSDRQSFDQNNSLLLNAQDTITVLIMPSNQSESITGKTVLDIVREYELKYGVMNMFHRYQRKDGTGNLWFSMLGLSDEGLQPFDLNELTESEFSGLSLFLSLPNPHALSGFDSMVAVAKMIADDLNASLYGEEGHLLDDAQLDRMRVMVADYQ